MGNTYFHHKNLHRYIMIDLLRSITRLAVYAVPYRRVARGQYLVVVKCMINLVLVNKDMQCYLQDETSERNGMIPL